MLVCINAALYIFIIILDSMNASGDITRRQGLVCDFMKYAAIISCLIICLFARSHSRRQVARIQAVVFCITLVADFFLLFTPYFTAGVLVFIAAHTCALLRYKPRWALSAGICAAALFASAFLLMTPLFHPDPGLKLVVASCIAYATLIISVAISTFHAEQPRLNTLFSRAGMLLFLACDVNVAIFNALPAGSALHTASIVLMWLFYLPAQTLLALSATDLKDPINTTRYRSEDPKDPANTARDEPEM